MTQRDLRRWLETWGMSQCALARRLGISERRVRAWLADPATVTSARAPDRMLPAVLALLEMEMRLHGLKQHRLCDDKS